ncbi:MAG: signal peptidase II [Acetatifactor sp.]|nr:signal peptidase II [Acetatifactor sp.]
MREEVSLNKKKALMLFFDILLGIFLVWFDQFTKGLAISHLKGRSAYSLIDGVLELQYLENHGMAFGMLQNQKVFILFVGIIFMLVLLFFLLKMPITSKFKVIHVLMVFIISGGLGNMMDRLRLDYVVDFIYFVLINFPIFNVADCYIVISVIGLFILFLFVFKEKDLEFLNFKQNRYREMK